MTCPSPIRHSPSPVVRRFNDVIADDGHCGARRRLLAAGDELGVGISHLTIAAAPVHLHRVTTEIYYILSGTGRMTVGSDVVLVGPGDTIAVPPGVAHGAVADSVLEVLIVMVPPLAEDGDLLSRSDHEPG